jgi:hypothetical protein
MQLYQSNLEVGQQRQWMIQANGVYQPCGPTVPKLPPGAYTPTQDPWGNPMFQGRSLHVDDLIDFTDSLPSQVVEEISQFWGKETQFKRYGFLHRRGYLFYGKQGCGKSSLIHQIIAQIAQAGNVAFFCEDPNLFLRAVEHFRIVEPNRPMVCVFEDIDALIATWGDSALLQWLDGNHQVDKAVNIASTNYPEKLDRRIIARPRRFDRVLKILPPSARVRNAYFSNKMGDLSPAELNRWVELSANLPFAALAELVISVRCLDKSLEEAVDLLRELDQHNPSSGEFASTNNEEPASDVV